MYYNKEGKKISSEEWVRLVENDSDYRTVKQENVGKYYISTVWLGLDHSFDGGKPIIFETMVFGDDDEIQERYSTLEEAKKGHKEMVRKYKIK